MYFLYKTKRGKIRRTKFIRMVSPNVSKLIIKKYNGSKLNLRHIDELIIDLNGNCISDITFSCIKLSVYNNLENWISLNDNCHYEEVVHYDMRAVTDLDYSFNNRAVRKICPLDCTGIINLQAFARSSALTEIPTLLNIGKNPITKFAFNNTDIIYSKIETWRTLHKIKK